jgi:hypothetical protein
MNHGRNKEFHQLSFPRKNEMGESVITKQEYETSCRSELGFGLSQI